VLAVRDPLPELPYLRPWYRLATHDGKLVLEYAQTAVIFEGRAVRRLLPALLPLLDGRRTVGDVVTALGAAAQPAVEAALSALAARGLLTDGPPVDPEAPSPIADTACFLAASTGACTVADAESALASAKVAVAGGGACADELARLLLRAGVGTVDPVAWGFRLDDTVDLAVAAPEPAEVGQLPAWNDGMLRARLAWLQLLPYDGRFVAIGPLFVPGQTCCYECFRLRRRSNVEYFDEFRSIEETAVRAPVSPPFAAAAGGIAAVVALQWLACRDKVHCGWFYAFERGGLMALSIHQVLRVPRCPACSPAAQAGAPLTWFKEPTK
jgi:bacteriocin biosynthesis cyclodehydratase domain-containing protein